MKFPQIKYGDRTLWPRQRQRAVGDPTLSVDQWLSFFTFGGTSYPFIPNQTMVSKKEDIPNSFSGYVQGAYKSNGVVFSCMVARMLLFSEARFQFRQMRNGRPGDLFGTAELAILDTPWSGGTTGDLLGRAIQDVDLAGNFYAVRHAGQIKRLRPDWVTIVMGSRANPSNEEIKAGDLDAEVIGYLYHPGGPNSPQPVEVLGVDQVCHFAPIPDPTAHYRGMSWITPVIREIMGDSAATSHKLSFFENGATVNLAVSLDPSITEAAFQKWVQIFKQDHQGVLNAYKTLFLGGGANVQPVGSSFQQIEFKATQGAGETRICAAARVPPIIVGLSEGLAAATYSNYGQACRSFANTTMRPLWRNLAGSLSRIINVPPRAELWYDDRDIMFLQEDQTDRAQIQQSQATTIRTLVDAGFDPDSVVGAVIGHDFKQLVHSGMYSVQLQPPGEFGEPGGPSTPPAAALPAAKSTPPKPNGKSKQGATK